MAIYRTEVHERAAGAVRERSVALPDSMIDWASLLVYGRDSYFNDRLSASIRMNRMRNDCNVRIKVLARHLPEVLYDKKEAAQLGVARYFSAPQLLADMTDHVERALPGDWRNDWKILHSDVRLTANRGCKYSDARSLGPVLDRLVGHLWPLEKTYVEITER